MIVGAGFAGLDAGVKLKEMGMKFTILEKSSRLGGTWWDNQYPGAACDIASHLYSLSYYLNPWWSRAYRFPNLNSPPLHIYFKLFDIMTHEVGKCMNFWPL